MNYPQPTFFGRLLALVQGEVSGQTLEAYRSAGRAVFEALQSVEDRRLDLKVKGVHPCKVDAPSQLFFLCSWNAFMLQVMADKLLEADYQSQPATAGYLPKVTAEQAMAYYAQVESWLSRAQQAQHNPNYRLETALPATLPDWSPVEPCPKPHIEAMLAAARAARTHAEAAMASYEQDNLDDHHAQETQTLRGILAEINSKTSYAEGLLSGSVNQETHEAAEERLKAALEGYYRVGQLLSMPSLLKGQPKPQVSSAARGERAAAAMPLPGQAGFDPWLMTDRIALARFKNDEKAIEAIECVWQYDPDPAKTLLVWSEIQEARLAGEVEHAGVGYYYALPFGPIFEARRPLKIFGTSLRKGDQFTYTVSAEEVIETGRKDLFEREIVVGQFKRTNQVDYRDPHEEGHGNENR